ncbi:MAG TPA: hypothetical protein VEA99_06840 [Gemmatimonadaceae bacterium]|nr:hypothetical protein [Gemmatimonadaceae bacterium]
MVQRVIRSLLLAALVAAPLAACSGRDARASASTAEGNPHRTRPDSVMPGLGAESFNIVVPIRITGQQWYVVGRAVWEGSAVLFTAPGGRIPLFEVEKDAWAFAERVLPPQSEGGRSLSRTMRDYREKVIANRAIDLDAVKRYAVNGDHDAARPETVLEGWQLLAWAGELFVAPQPSRYELSVEAQPASDRAELPAPQALRASVTALHALVLRSVAFNAKTTGTRGSPEWPFGGGIWSDDDDERIGAALLAAHAAFSERLSEDVKGVEYSVPSALLP